MKEVNNKFSYACSSTHWLVTGSIIDGSKLRTIDSFKFLWLGYLKPPPPIPPFHLSVNVFVPCCSCVPAPPGNLPGPFSDHLLAQPVPHVSGIIIPMLGLGFQGQTISIHIWQFSHIFSSLAGVSHILMMMTMNMVVMMLMVMLMMMARKMTMWVLVATAGGDKSKWKQWRRIEGGRGMQGHQRGNDDDYTMLLVLVVINRLHWSWCWSWSWWY